ncbi:hypothetical protein [Cryptosporangium japonicum]|uniref:Uncharacterized protein n=1 Tax=Cryptosporangium japonicum TaxID=80872 RepID=A0ABP3D3C8_9ACTN
MSAEPVLVLRRDLTVAADHSQIYIYSADLPDGGLPFDDSNPFLDALTDATESDRFVGVTTGLVDLLTPGQWNWTTPMRLEVWASEPAGDTADWDHEVDVDLTVPDGRLWLEASGGGPTTETEVPAGSYRMRVSGKGFAAVRLAGRDGSDSYRLQLWPTATAREPLLRKRWPGWDTYQ